MNEFFEERAREIRRLAELADPFTKTRLLKLAERYDYQGEPFQPARRRTNPLLPTFNTARE
jgi:hypothetical protein